MSGGPVRRSPMLIQNKKSRLLPPPKPEREPTADELSPEPPHAPATRGRRVAASAVKDASQTGARQGLCVPVATGRTTGAQCWGRLRGFGIVQKLLRTKSRDIRGRLGLGVGLVLRFGIDDGTLRSGSE